MGIRDMAWMCDLISPIVKLYTLLTVIHTIRLRGRPSMAGHKAQLMWQGQTLLTGFHLHTTHSKLQRALCCFILSFLFFSFLTTVKSLAIRTQCRLRFKLQALRYFAKFRREMSTSVFPVKIRPVGLGLTGFGLVCRTLRWQNENPKKRRRKTKEKNLKINKNKVCTVFGFFF